MLSTSPSAPLGSEPGADTVAWPLRGGAWVQSPQGLKSVPQHPPTEQGVLSPQTQSARARARPPLSKDTITVRAVPVGRPFPGRECPYFIWCLGIIWQDPCIDLTHTGARFSPFNLELLGPGGLPTSRPCAEAGSSGCWQREWESSVGLTGGQGHLLEQRLRPGGHVSL